MMAWTDTKAFVFLLDFYVFSILWRIPGTQYLIIDNAAIGIYYFPMARIARVVVPGLPHHITQRGNRRQETFFVDDDFG